LNATDSGSFQLQDEGLKVLVFLQVDEERLHARRAETGLAEVASKVQVLAPLQVSAGKRKTRWAGYALNADSRHGCW